MKPEKKHVALALLNSGTVFVHLDPRKPEVCVPLRLRLQAQVVLQFGFDMPTPIPDMVVGETGISGTLSFKGVPFKVDVPWSAVFALVGEDARGLVWDEEMPKEIAAQVAAEKTKLAHAPLKTQGLTAIDGGKSASKASKKERPSHLRLVKK